MEHNSQSKLEAVRDLIFGATLSEFEAKVEQLEIKVSRNNDQILREINNLKTKLNESIVLMEQNITQRIENLYTAAKAELDRQNAVHISREKLSVILSQIAKEL